MSLRSPIYTDEDEALRDQIVRFCEREILPHGEAWEEQGEFTRDLYTKAGAAGLLGIGFPEDYGGGGGDVLHYCMVREELSRYQSDHACEACGGARLKPQALAVKLNELHIGHVAQMSIREAGDWFEALPAKLSAKQNEIAVRILKEIRERLRFLNDVGLDYLALSRNSGTLSGGESQRIRLASQIADHPVGVVRVELLKVGVVRRFLDAGFHAA